MNEVEFIKGFDEFEWNTRKNRRINMILGMYFLFFFYFPNKYINFLKLSELRATDIRVKNPSQIYIYKRYFTY